MSDTKRDRSGRHEMGGHETAHGWVRYSDDATTAGRTKVGDGTLIDQT